VGAIVMKILRFVFCWSSVLIMYGIRIRKGLLCLFISVLVADHLLKMSHLGSLCAEPLAVGFDVGVSHRLMQWKAAKNVCLTHLCVSLLSFLFICSDAAKLVLFNFIVKSILIWSVLDAASPLSSLRCLAFLQVQCVYSCLSVSSICSSSVVTIGCILIPKSGDYDHSRGAILLTRSKHLVYTVSCKSSQLSTAGRLGCLQ